MPPRRDRLSEATLVFALAMVCYTANAKTIPSGDTQPARHLPFSILREGDFDLDEFPFLHRAEHYFVRHTGGHWVSSYPVGAAVLATPFYLPAVLAGADARERRTERLEKLAAAAIVALSAAFLFATLSRLVDRRASWWITIAYALGTSSLSVSSQALWQHGSAQLCLICGIYLLVAGRGARAWAIALAGLPLAFAVVCRPTNLVLVAPLAAYVLVRHPRQFALFLCAALVPAGFQLGYNLAYWNDPFWTQFPFGDRRWRGIPGETLAGLAFSPSRGLFVYSPVLIFGFWGMARSVRSGGDPLVRAVGVGVALLAVVYSKWAEWWGGYCYGPRMLADVTPLLAFAMFSCADLIRGPGPVRLLFAVTLAWSVLAHGAGAYWEDGRWNTRLESRQRTTWLWSWSDNQLVNSLRDAAGQAAAVATAPRQPPRVDVMIPHHRLDWHFEDELTLLGIDWRPVSAEEIEVAYYWRAERPPSADYAVYTRLVGPGCAWRHDFVPGAPGRQTSKWTAGETVVASQRVPRPAAIGAEGCELRAGVWAPHEGRHLYARAWPRWRRQVTVLTVVPQGAGARR